MNVINVIGLFLMSFTFLNFIFSLKKWSQLKNYKYPIKGVIEEVSLYENKIFFNIKWHIPNELLEQNPPDNLGSTVQYYSHTFKNLGKMNIDKQKLLFTEVQNKYTEQGFYLLLKEESGVIRDLKPYEKPVGSAILNGIIFICLLSALLINFGYSKGMFV